MEEHDKLVLRAHPYALLDASLALQACFELILCLLFLILVQPTTFTNALYSTSHMHLMCWLDVPDILGYRSGKLIFLYSVTYDFHFYSNNNTTFITEAYPCQALAMIGHSSGTLNLCPIFLIFFFWTLLNCVSNLLLFYFVHYLKTSDTWCLSSLCAFFLHVPLFYIDFILVSVRASHTFKFSFFDTFLKAFSDFNISVKNLPFF